MRYYEVAQKRRRRNEADTLRAVATALSGKGVNAKIRKLLRD